MLARMKLEQPEGGSRWWNEELAGQLVPVVFDETGALTGDGLEILPCEVDGLLPDDVDLFRARLQEAAMSALFKISPVGEVVMYLRAGQRVPVLPREVLLAHDGTVWLRLIPELCPRCGCAEQRQLVSVMKPAVVIDRRCAYCDHKL